MTLTTAIMLIETTHLLNTTNPKAGVEVDDGDYAEDAEAEDDDDDGPHQAPHDRQRTMMTVDRRRHKR